MVDFARSDHPGVQAQLDRLGRLSSGVDILGLDRITLLLARLGDPHRAMPPVFHVAGTNGKGSTCAFLRTALEAAGQRVHVYTSPHLVRFNERIRLAGRLIEDDALAVLLAEVLDHADDLGASFFEVTTAAAFLAFARTPADACVVEVGLGGRLDATNVVTPLVCGIAQLGIDHQAFLGDTAEAIAGEKAGIAKPGVPLVTMRYPPSVAGRVAAVASEAGAPVLALDSAWRFRVDVALHVEDAAGRVALPLPSLAGSHQPGNLALAIAMLRAQDRIDVPEAALASAAIDTRWPARMQRLGAGPLVDRLPQGSELWLDGGHNAAAADAVAASIGSLSDGGPIHLVLGMLANKDARALLTPLAALADSLTAVPIHGHEHHAPADLAALARSLGIRATGVAKDVPAALDGLAGAVTPAAPVRVLVLGSLYLAGEVLGLNGEYPG